MAGRGDAADFAGRLALSLVIVRHGEIPEDVSDGMARLIVAINETRVTPFASETLFALLDECYHQISNTAGCASVDDVVRA